MNHLICGFGDVGRGLYEVIQDKCEVVAIDKDNKLEGHFDVLHICFPYSENFVDHVNHYLVKYTPGLTFIHATVPPGTTRSICSYPDIVHSPVRGRHPKMDRDMKTYTKYVGGTRYEEAEKILIDLGFKTKAFPNPETTELGKLLSNIRWGLNIAFAQEQKRMCEHYRVKYEDVVNEFEKSKNVGLKEIDRADVLMPIIFPGFIGGHCVMPNVDILFSGYPSVFLKAIMESNEKYGKKE